MSYNTFPDSVDFASYLASTEVSSHKMVRPSASLKDTLEYMYGDSTGNDATLPFFQMRGLFKLKAGEVTVWAGANGHGKSLVTSQVQLGLMQQGYVVGVASFEMKHAALNKRLISQAAGGFPPEAYTRKFLEWSSNYLWYYDKLGNSTANDMLGLAKYAARECAVQHLFIDNLMTVVDGEDNYNAQKDFVFKLCDIARDEKIHIHIVHHIRKLENEEKIPSKFDIKGSSSIVDRVDNAIIVFRSKWKESQLRKPVNEQKADIADFPDAKLLIVKQRDEGHEGEIKLWYDVNSKSYQEAKITRRPAGWDVPEIIKPVDVFLKPVTIPNDNENTQKEFKEGVW